jgi:hypothetical protein
MSLARKERIKTIKEFLERWKHLPEQGSDEWKADRTFFIGGSEAEMCETSLATLVAYKIGLKTMPVMLAMLWGNFFENIIRTVCEVVCGTRIYEAGSIPSDEVPTLKKYSMDGMGCTKFRLSNGRREYKITLFEFKCLYSRIPVHGEIPKNYRPQVKGGMCDLSITEIALFVEGVFRLCNIDQLGYNPLKNSTLIKKDHINSKSKPFAYGVVGVYADSLPVDNPYALEKLLAKMQAEKLPDYGLDEGFDYVLLEYVFKCVREKKFETWYSPMCFDGKGAAEHTKLIELHGFKQPMLHTDIHAQVQGFVDWAAENDKILIGIVPWKLFDINMVTAEKEPGYTLAHKPQYEKAINIVRELMAITDPADRYNAYNAMFFPPTQEDIDQKDSMLRSFKALQFSDSDDSDSEPEPPPVVEVEPSATITEMLKKITLPVKSPEKPTEPPPTDLVEVAHTLQPS